MRRFSLALAIATCGFLVSAGHAFVGVGEPVNAFDQTHGLGRPATPEEIKKLDAIIPPTGAGLPAGSGTAEKGKAIYAAQCARCHGATGREGPEDVLVGGLGTLTTPRPVRTVGSYWPYATTLWDYINRAMPFDRPGMLPPDDVYAVTAFVLQLNGIVTATDVLDAATLPKIQMPNRGGFTRDPRPAVRAPGGPVPRN